VLQGYLRDIGQHVRNLQRSVNDMEELVAMHDEVIGIADAPDAKPIKVAGGETYAWDMLTVVAPLAGWGTIALDGAPLPDPTDLGAGGLGYARFLIPDGPHDIRSPTTKFGLEVYGYDCRISYAYPGGLSLGEINQPPG
jgi:hypothetical protein